MIDIGKDISICNVKRGKIFCHDVPAGKDPIPPLPRKIAWLLVIVSLGVRLPIGLVHNHLTMSITIDTPSMFKGGHAMKIVDVGYIMISPFMKLREITKDEFLHVAESALYPAIA